MKELSIEEKAKCYDEALERAKDFMNGEVSYALKRGENIMCWIFPELAESEDERIRKALIHLISQQDGFLTAINGIGVKDILAWLEKQCSDFRYPTIYDKTETRTTTMEAMKKQGEQKPANKVGPKFKAGDWVVTDKGDIVQIEAINDGYYTLYNGMDFSISYVDKCWHLWTIDDAKDGDVLVCIGKHGQEIGVIKEYVGKHGGCDKCFETYCFVDWDGIFRTGEYMGSKEIHPATKEQRDLLFQKMKEAGYEWDAKKKELKKIGNKNPMLSDFFKYEYERGKAYAQKSTEWSEEDEKMLNQIISIIKNADDDLIRTENISIYTNWLKSKMQPQLKWKPSELQIEALESATENCAYSEYQDCLKELIIELKKLTE